MTLSNRPSRIRRSRLLILAVATLISPILLTAPAQAATTIDEFVLTAPGARGSSLIVDTGEEVTVNWAVTSDNPITVSATGDWTGDDLGDSGTQNVSFDEAGTYTLGLRVVETLPDQSTATTNSSDTLEVIVRDPETETVDQARLFVEGCFFSVPGQDGYTAYGALLSDQQSDGSFSRVLDLRSAPELAEARSERGLDARKVPDGFVVIAQPFSRSGGYEADLDTKVLTPPDAATCDVAIPTVAPASGV